MPPRSASLFTALYLAGDAILLLAFFLLVPEDLRDVAGYLDLCVVLGVFTLNFPIHSLGWAFRSGDAFRIPALSIRWFGTGVYSLFALAGVVRGALAAVQFRFQLIYQLVCLFGLLAAMVLATRATSHTAVVDAEERANVAGLRELHEAAAGVEEALVFMGEGWQQQRTAIQMVREDLRFLSPSPRRPEQELEGRLTAELRDIRVLLNATDLAAARADVDARLVRCAALMSVRKQPNIRQGDSR
jgi:hypothetical protein